MRREGDQGARGDGAGAQGPHIADDLDLERRAVRRRIVQLVSLLALVVILVAFVVENAQRVKIHFVFFTKDVRPIWLMLTSAILGGLVGYLVGRPGRQVRMRRKGKGKGQGKDAGKKA